jgi:hypothetical protein
LTGAFATYEVTPIPRQLLPLSRLGRDFLNVDEIQRNASPPLTNVAAAREFLTRLNQVESARRSFALETTLSSRSYAARLSSGRLSATMLSFISSSYRPPILPSIASPNVSLLVVTTCQKPTSVADSNVAAHSSLRYTKASFPNTSTG